MCAVDQTTLYVTSMHYNSTIFLNFIAVCVVECTVLLLCSRCAIWSALLCLDLRVCAGFVVGVCKPPPSRVGVHQRL